MASIQSTIKLFNGYTPVIQNMIRANQTIIASFRATETASGNAFDDSAIKQAIDYISKAEVAYDDVERQIKEVDNAQNRLNDDMRKGQGFADGIKNKFLGVASAVAAAFSAKKIIELADNMTSTNARLDLIVEDGGSVAELQDKIMASANRGRAAYQTTADAVSKMALMAGDAFSSNDEIIAFTEQLNKQFTIAGTNAAGVDNAMLQLTQAMASGVLRGDELNSIFEQAPTIIQSIADYLDVPIGRIREMAAEGQITADIVKNSMFAAADETDAKFKQMPMTWAQVWTVAKNTILQAFEPVIQAIGAGATWIYDNWSTIAPVFYGIAAAIGVLAAAFAIWKVVTLAQTIAQWALNSALLANPITWIVLAIAAIVGAIVIWINKIGDLKVAWLTVCNAIMTAFDWVQIGFFTGIYWVQIGFFTGIYWVLDLFNKMKLGIMEAATAIANFMGDMKANVLMILQNMVNGAIDIINGFISILNKIPGVNIGVIEQVTFGTTAQLENDAAKQARNAALEDYRSEIDAGIAERQASLEAMKNDARTATANRLAEIDSVKAEQASKAAEDHTSAFNQASTLDQIAQNTADTAANTGSMADSVNMSSEDIKYLPDAAEREAVNRYLTVDFDVDMSGMSNNISSEMDLDGVVGYLNEAMNEAINIAAEGVHY